MAETMRVLLADERTALRLFAYGGGDEADSCVYGLQKCAPLRCALCTWCMRLGGHVVLSTDARRALLSHDGGDEEDRCTSVCRYHKRSARASHKG